MAYQENKALSAIPARCFFFSDLDVEMLPIYVHSTLLVLGRNKALHHRFPYSNHESFHDDNHLRGALKMVRLLDLCDHLAQITCLQVNGKLSDPACKLIFRTAQDKNITSKVRSREAAI